jgi:hypothetical protein
MFTYNTAYQTAVSTASAGLAPNIVHCRYLAKTTVETTAKGTVQRMGDVVSREGEERGGVILVNTTTEAV